MITIVSAPSDDPSRRHSQIRSANATGERWWASWSPLQHCVHLEREHEALETNLRAFALNRVVEYVPLAIFDSEEEARAFLSAVQEIRDRRSREGDQ
ncbi:hypothetical protein GC207_10465 [bacterium]|nr:hypothetical protein [bacterium]